MRAQLILCDAAQADANGKVHILGAGWTITQTPLPPQSIVALVGLTFPETESQHVARLQLEDADGRVVTAPDNTVLTFDQPFQVNLPPGAPAGLYVPTPIVLNIGPGLPVPPGDYVWRLQVDGDTDENWTAPFQVRAPG